MFASQQKLGSHTFMQDVSGYIMECWRSDNLN